MTTLGPVVTAHSTGTASAGLRALVAAAVLPVMLLGGTAAAAPPVQTVDGKVLGPLEVPLSELPGVVLDVHSGASPVLNGTVTQSFNITGRGAGRRFTLAARRIAEPGTAQQSQTFGVVFLDKPLSSRGASVVAVVDKHVDRVEAGAVPAKARSAYVYATHGTNRGFRFQLR